MIRERWAQTNLGDLLDRSTDRLGTRREPRILTVTEGAGVVDQLQHWGRRVAAEDVRSYKVVYPGDVAYNVYLLWNGAIGQNRFTSLGITSPVYEVFRPRDSVDVDFVGILLQSNLLRERYDAISIGTIPRRRRAPWQDFLKIRVALPPLDAQRRIVDLIAALDEVRRLLDLSAGRSAAARDALTGCVQSDGSDVRISEIADVSQGRSLPSQVQGEQSGDIPWFKIADMTTAPNVLGYRQAATSFTSDEVRRLGGVIVPVGAVVFPRVGAAVLTEKKRVMDVAGALDENHLILTPRKQEDSELLLAVMERFRLASLVQQGAVPSLNMAKMRSTIVRWPSDRVAANVTGALGESRRMARKLKTLIQQHQSFRVKLLSALLSGEHEIPGSYDDLVGV